MTGISKAKLAAAVILIIAAIVSIIINWEDAGMRDFSAPAETTVSSSAAPVASRPVLSAAAETEAPAAEPVAPEKERLQPKYFYTLPSSVRLIVPRSDGSRVFRQLKVNDYFEVLEAVEIDGQPGYRVIVYGGSSRTEIARGILPAGELEGLALSPRPIRR